MQRAGFLLMGFLLMSGPLIGQPEVRVIDLLGTAPREFWENWETQGFPLIPPTEYSVDVDDGAVRVVGTSEGGNRALLRKIAITRPKRAILNWQWRIQEGLSGKADERTKAGDDYAARVFVVFERSLVPGQTRAINYVWAAEEKIGSLFASPYSRQIAHLVMRSGSSDSAARSWRMEQRDVLADYEKFFGEPATKISGVAIMVDADNTDDRAVAAFKRLILEISPTG